MRSTNAKPANFLKENELTTVNYVLIPLSFHKTFKLI